MNYGGNAKLSVYELKTGAQFNTSVISYPIAQRFFIYDRGNGKYSISPANANNPLLVIGQSEIVPYNAPLIQLMNYSGVKEEWELRPQ